MLENGDTRMRIQERIFHSREEILRIAAKHGAWNVRLFGSVLVESVENPHDVDFLVEMDKGHSLLDRIALIQDLEDLLQCQVDVISERGLHRFIKDQVLENAQPL